MKMVIGGDSAGAPLVKVLFQYLGAKGVNISDLSISASNEKESYAKLSARIATKIINGEFDRGILCCGTGIGVCISANKIPGIRAALTHDTYSAQRAALSNNAQIITMGARVIGPELAKSIADAWLAETFDSEGPSAGNVAEINALDIS